MNNLTRFLKILLVFPALVAGYLIVSAHFIWIETAGIATIGKEYPVNIFFGEVNANQKEVAGGRLDEMDGLKTVCITPKSVEKELQLTKQNDRFSAKFIPEETGLYQILTSNSIAKVMDLRKYQLGIVKPMFYAREFVLCVSSSNTETTQKTAIAPYFDLDLIPDFSTAKRNTFVANQPVNFYSYFKKKPIKGGKIVAYAPNGWSKEIDADANGLCTFTPLWEGQYVIDWVYPEDAPGTYKEKFFEFIRHRAVLTINVSK